MNNRLLDKYALQLLQALDNAIVLASVGRSVSPINKELQVIKAEYKKAVECDTGRNRTH